MKRLLIAGNWKMNTSLYEGLELIKQTIHSTQPLPENIKVLFCPPYVWLTELKILIDKNNFFLGAQNCYYKENGAFTGEISVKMIKEIGVSYVIIGHSERRIIFKESDELIYLKLKSAIDYGITPILCIGETLEERNKGNTYNVLETQIKTVFDNLTKEEINKIIIAYEPVWAIGTGISATIEQADEAHNYIKQYIQQNYTIAKDQITILYGGSLNEQNANELLNMPNIDGGLIGGASIKKESFIEIINIAKNLSS